MNISYKKLDEIIDRCVEWLKKYEIQSGDRVGVTISNESLLAIVFLSLARLGATYMSFPRSLTSIQRNTWARQSSISKHITNDVLVSIDGVRQIFVDQRWLLNVYAETLTPARRVIDADTKDKLLMIIIGSGSTGNQKLIPVTHGQMMARIEGIIHANQNVCTDRIATMAHMEYAAGLHRLLSALWSGATFVILDQKNCKPSDFNEKYQLTLLTATVFHLEKFLSLLQEDDHGVLGNIRLVSSGSALSNTLRSRVIKHLTPNFQIVYGTNEIWTVSIARVEDVRTTPDTVGRLIPSVEVQIVDEQMRQKPIGEIGLIRIRGAGLICGYLDNAEADTRAFRDGWFLPMDLGKIDEAGQLIFCGRADDLMIYNGINIAPVEIENVLLDHPAVFDVKAFPLDHEVHQDIPVAAVSLRNKASRTVHAELLRHARDRLGFRAPRMIFILESIPRDVQGKIAKEEFVVEINRFFQSERNRVSIVVSR